MRDVVVASELLKPYDAQRMRRYCVSVRINRELPSVRTRRSEANAKTDFDLPVASWFFLS